MFFSNVIALSLAAFALASPAPTRLFPREVLECTDPGQSSAFNDAMVRVELALTTAYLSAQNNVDPKKFETSFPGCTGKCRESVIATIKYAKDHQRQGGFQYTCTMADCLLQPSDIKLPILPEWVPDPSDAPVKVKICKSFTDPENGATLCANNSNRVKTLLLYIFMDALGRTHKEPGYELFTADAAAGAHAQILTQYTKGKSISCLHVGWSPAVLTRQTRHASHFLAHSQGDLS